MFAGIKPNSKEIESMMISAPTVVRKRLCPISSMTAYHAISPRGIPIFDVPLYPPLEFDRGRFDALPFRRTIRITIVARLQGPADRKDTIMKPTSHGHALVLGIDDLPRPRPSGIVSQDRSEDPAFRWKPPREACVSVARCKERDRAERLTRL